MRGSNIRADGAKISVITRTLGHMPFLRRCRASIEEAAQGYTIQWIIVDDEREQTEDPLESFCDEVREGRLIEPYLVRARARHRAMAANEGLKVVAGEYVHILDDDDTIRPDFYRETIGILQRDPRPGAAAVKCERIVEKPSGEQPLTYAIAARSVHYPEISAITLGSLAVNQTLPLISIVFRRKALAEVGPFDPEFAVGEDYELLLRFLQRRDIALSGKVLASFHQRVEASGAFGNSRSTTNFAEENAYFRNAMLRRDLREGQIGLGWLLMFGELMSGSVKTDRLLTQLYKNRMMNSLFSRLRRL